MSDAKCRVSGSTMDEVGPKVSSRLIGPSIHRRSTELVLDDPMIRWSDGKIAAALHDVLETKGG